MLSSLFSKSRLNIVVCAFLLPIVLNAQKPLKRPVMKQNVPTVATHKVRASHPTVGYTNGHKWVDLGLSVKWATANIGASKVGESGDYYSWGDEKPKESYETQNNINYGENQRTAGSWEKVEWGGAWRIPTLSEFKELKENCKWVWTVINKKYRGYKVIGKNGNFIFLPVCGFIVGSDRFLFNTEGYYWTSEGLKNRSAYSYYLTDFILRPSICDRSIGRSVRPVIE